MTREEICNSMTLQDAIQVLKETNCYGTMDIAKSVIIKALEPQPKERTEERAETHACDYISRKLMMDMGATCIAARNEDGDLVALGALDILPSATPQPKVGRWIGHREHCEKLGVMPSGVGAYEWCSNCNYGIDIRDWNRINHNYCPNCGSYNGGTK